MSDADPRAEAWATLHASLRAAMVEGFARVGEPGLGARLLSQVDTWLETLPEVSAELRRWRARLDGFERLGRQDRSVLVARGMRLGAATKPAAEPEPKPRRIKISEPEPKVTRTRGRKARASGAEVPNTTAFEPGPALPEIESLAGVGPSTAKKLRARGLASLVDLVYVLPAGYEDRRHRKPVAAIEDGEVAVIEGEVGSIRQGFGRGRFLATVEIRVLDDDGGEHVVLARWFHRVGGLERWAKGGRVLAVGPARWYKGQLSLAHPELRDPADPGPAIGVRYPSVEGVAPRTLSRVVRSAVKALAEAEGFVDALPADIAADTGTVSASPGREPRLPLRVHRSRRGAVP